MTLTKQARDAIARAVGRLRALFEDEYADQARGRFGFHVDRRAGVEEPTAADRDNLDEDEQFLLPWVEPLSALSLSPSQVAQRSELVGALSYLRREGLDGGEAVARLIREAAFTSVNRLLAVRVGEAVGAFPEATANGRQSASYREVTQDLFPLLAQEEDEGFWRYLQVAGDELGATVPLLFDRRLPVSAFVPSRICIDKALDILNDPAVAEAWSEPEALGWSYQFFNGDDVRVMRDASPQAPRNPRELAVRNQFFTPRYVVDWLVQNTLGRRLRQAGYDVDLPLVVGDPEDHAPLALDDVKVLDPACGSGHFLLGCYDLLEEAWRVTGVSSADAAPRILRCLFGIEIDPRASQVAQAVLVLRARRSAPSVVFDPPVIVTARPLPGAPSVRRAAFERLSANARDLAEELDDALMDAASLGSLLKAEDRMASALGRTLDRPKLATDASEELLEQELLAVVEEIAQAADASPGARMFGADARDALRFLRLCQQRYQTVLMNPPFGAPIPATRDYVRAAYAASAGDLYAAFVERGVSLVSADGYVGAITSRTGFFLTTFESWREAVVLPRLRAMLDLGLNVMHDALVEAAAYALGPKSAHAEAHFTRLIDIADKASAIYSCSGDHYTRRPDAFESIDGAPAAYWLPEESLRIFRENPALNGAQGSAVREGLGTASDFRFVRLWWEVDASALGRHARWVPFAKGGEYSPYYSDLDLVLGWDGDGAAIKESGRATIRNPKFYYRPGLTWTYRTQKGFSVRPVPADCIFGNKGPMIFVKDDDPSTLTRLMGYLNSALVGSLLEPLAAFGSYTTGAIARAPVVDLSGLPTQPARDLVAARRQEAQRKETDHCFVSPWAGSDADKTDLVGLSEEVDSAVLGIVGFDDPARPLSVTFPTEWFRKDYKGVTDPTAHQEVSYLLGAALGRWDIRLASGDLLPPPLKGPYDALPPCSRGMLVGEDGLPSIAEPRNPVVVPPDRLLHDEPGHQQDVVAAIEHAAGIVQSGPSQVKLVLPNEIRDLRQHLRTRFFGEHLKDYSGSRRFAPIYWYLAVPSREWGVWAYAPTLSRETLFAVAGAARDRLRRLREHAAQLRGKIGGSAARQDVERVEKLDSLAEEVEEFLAVAEGVAQSGWTPDLNDGAVLCAAPLEPLFADDRWRREIAAHRTKLEKGQYPWATVQREYFGSKK